MERPERSSICPGCGNDFLYGDCGHRNIAYWAGISKAESAVIEAAQTHFMREELYPESKHRCVCGGWSTDWGIYYAVEALRKKEE